MIERYAVNYAWGHQPGGDVDVFVTLIGAVRGDAAVRAVRRWWLDLPPSERPAQVGWRYAGGVLVRVTLEDPAAATVAIRSRGEDAFDSIGWYAAEVTDLVSASARGIPDEQTVLTWVELPVEPEPFDADDEPKASPTSRVPRRPAAHSTADHPGGPPGPS